jgi:hypothetical protein
MMKDRPIPSTDRLRATVNRASSGTDADWHVQIATSGHRSQTRRSFYSSARWDV